MSQNYLGDLIYTYDKYRNRDFYKNLYLDPDFSCIGYMTAEQYVNRIGKKIKCSGKKKKEIKRQILSDVLVAMENGETVEIM